MKADWEVKTLGEVCTLRSGTTLSPSLEKVTGELPYLKVADMNLDENKGYITNSSRFVNNADVNRAGIIPAGSTIFPKRGGAILTNKKRMTSIPICMDLNLMAVTASNKILPSYLFFYFLNLDLRDINNGSSIPQINNYQIAPLLISYPKSLSEQQRIVAILDEAFAAIDKAKENAQKNLQNARELFDSYLQSVFANPGEGWEMKKVKEVAKHSLGKMLDKAKNQGVPQKYLRNINVRWFDVETSDMLEMLFRPEEFDKYTVRKGDVLICEGGYPGRAAIWQEDYPVYFQKAIHRVRFHNSEYNKLFVYFLYISNSNGYLKSYCSGVGIQHFTGESLSQFVVPLPPVKEAKTIVTKLDALSAETKKLEAIYKQKLTDLDELKKAILQKAFQGELTTAKAEALAL